MLAKRIIPCLDIKDGQTVKGINFLGLKDVGDPVELGRRYAEQGADELVYLDISATQEGRTDPAPPEAQRRGAGEILFTSMDHDGTKNGYPCDTYARLSERLSIPVIASGGAGSVRHIADVLTFGKADAALAASIFHYGEIPIPSLKRQLYEQHITVRL